MKKLEFLVWVKAAIQVLNGLFSAGFAVSYFTLYVRPLSDDIVLYTYILKWCQNNWAGTMVLYLILLNASYNIYCAIWSAYTSLNDPE